jgi:hypothetical protein
MKTGDEYTCTPKACGHRTPWANRSCSAKEDFDREVECYLSRVGDDGIANCVEKEECPTGYPGVCGFIYAFINFYFRGFSH